MIRKLEDFRINAFSRRSRLRVEDFEVWVVNREDLILSKLDWARESLSARQLSDVENLIAGNCDMDYLRKWVWSSMPADLPEPPRLLLRIRSH